MIPVRPLILVSVATASVLVSRPAFAGPPLLCFPFDIGSARTIPMGTAGWRDRSVVRRHASRRRHAGDPRSGHAVAVRMETLRRATVYASTNPRIANALLNALRERAARERGPQRVRLRLSGGNLPASEIDFRRAGSRD